MFLVCMEGSSPANGPLSENQREEKSQPDSAPEARLEKSNDWFSEQRVEERDDCDTLWQCMRGKIPAGRDEAVLTSSAYDSGLRTQKLSHTSHYHDKGGVDTYLGSVVTAA